MITAIENNIKFHFIDNYINRLVNVVFKLKASSNKKVLRKELDLVKKDIKEGTTTCDEKYHEWLNKYRHFIVPK
jgi:hypothetical protein